VATAARGLAQRAEHAGRRAGHSLSEFWVKAYTDNVTGLAGMVAYNLLLSVFPLALLAIFIASQVIRSGGLEGAIQGDLRGLFPSATEATLESLLSRVREGSTSFGLFALGTSIYFGSSFWGALDTAFCRIYPFRCRTWLEQKRFALAMLVVVLVFMTATVAVPTLQSILVSGAADLPFGLSGVPGLIFSVSLGIGLVLLFVIYSLIYATVPNERMPWQAVWPGALGATLATGVVDYAFPFYISQVSTVMRFGTTFVFVLIVLLWFYALAIIMLGGGVLNAMRFAHMGRSPEPPAEAAARAVAGAAEGGGTNGAARSGAEATRGTALRRAPP
jgi:YihY family inner membrane protein